MAGANNNTNNADPQIPASQRRTPYRQVLPAEAREDPGEDAYADVIKSLGLSSQTQQSMLVQREREVARLRGLSPDGQSHVSDVNAKRELANSDIRDLAFDATYNTAQFAKEHPEFSPSDIKTLVNAPQAKPYLDALKQTSPYIKEYIAEVNKIPGLTEAGRDNLILSARVQESDSKYLGETPKPDQAKDDLAQNIIVTNMTISRAAGQTVTDAAGRSYQQKDIEAIHKFAEEGGRSENLETNTKTASASQQTTGQTAQSNRRPNGPLVQI